MSPPEAMAAARAAGVQIAIDGTDLVLEASGPPPDAILDLLTRYKLGSRSAVPIDPATSTKSTKRSSSLGAW